MGKWDYFPDYFGVSILRSRRLSRGLGGALHDFDFLILLPMIGFAASSNLLAMDVRSLWAGSSTNIRRDPQEIGPFVWGVDGRRILSQPDHTDSWLSCLGACLVFCRKSRPARRPGPGFWHANTPGPILFGSLGSAKTALSPASYCHVLF